MKDVVGYENIYGITSCGRVWSYQNKCFLKPQLNKKGYLQVSLYKNGNRKVIRIHKLVAEAYLPNPNNLPQINHKDECKTNNCLQNLEWCNAKYNVNYGSRIDRIAASNKKPILQYDLDGNFVREWPSATDVGKEVKGNICNCLKGKLPTAYGYKWKYKDDINTSD